MHRYTPISHLRSVRIVSLATTRVLVLTRNLKHPTRASTTTRHGFHPRICILENRLLPHILHFLHLRMDQALATMTKRPSKRWNCILELIRDRGLAIKTIIPCNARGTEKEGFEIADSRGEVRGCADVAPVVVGTVFLRELGAGRVMVWEGVRFEKLVEGG